MLPPRPALIAFGVGALAVGAVLAFRGTYGSAVGALLVGGALVLLATWAWGYPTTAFPGREWIAIGVAAAGLMVLGRPVLDALVVTAGVALQLLSGLRVARELTETEIARVGPEAVLPEAKGAVAELEELGFRRAGEHSAELRENLVIFSVLGGPHADRFAVVTDRVVEVVSRFGDRWLVTSNSGIAPLPDDILRQLVVVGGPMELAAAHESALDVLAQRGIRPDRFETDGELLDSALTLEARATASFSSRGLGGFLEMQT